MLLRRTQVQTLIPVGRSVLSLVAYQAKMSRFYSFCLTPRNGVIDSVTGLLQSKVPNTAASFKLGKTAKGTRINLIKKC